MNKQSIRDRIGKFTYLNVTHYASMACYSAFVVAYMTKRGFSSTQIGLILTINSLISIFAPPVWGMLCDRLRSVRKVYIGHCAVLAVIVPVITFLPRYVFFLFWIPLIVLFSSSGIPLLDAWVVQGVKAIPGKSYGSIRLWGALGFMATVAAMGWLSDMTGMEVTFWVFSLFMTLSAIISFSIRSEGVPDTQGGQKRVRFREIEFGKLFRNRFYIIFVLCAFLIHLPMTLKFGFLVQRVYLAGGSDTVYGLCQAIAALIEIPTFFFSARLLAKFKPQRVIKASLVIYFLHFFLLSLPLRVPSLLLIQPLQGIGYSLFVTSSVAYIDSLSPGYLKTSALTFATALYSGASGIIGNLFAGLLIDKAGILHSFRYGSYIIGISVLLYFALFKIVSLKHPEPEYNG